MKIINLGILLIDISLALSVSLSGPDWIAGLCEPFLMGIDKLSYMPHRLTMVFVMFLVSITLLNIGIIQYFRQRMINKVALSGVLLMDISFASGILIWDIVVPQIAPSESGFGATPSSFLMFTFST